MVTHRLEGGADEKKNEDLGKKKRESHEKKNRLDKKGVARILKG